ncbi:MAG: hypothetical protein COA79_01285 [Planctomycetota bacterium]|nr:MAG: hypothetical protein COA79_01285 [Planctomycetota bacterium]
MFRCILLVAIIFSFAQLINCDEGKFDKKEKALDRIEFNKPIIYKNLLEAKKRIKNNESVLILAYQKLIKDAKEELKKGPYSVMSKKLVAKSGNKHDYLSMGTYWWPNPKTANGLPYVRKDGLTNPDNIKNTDSRAYNKMLRGVNKLCLAYFFTENEEYATHAAKLLKTWFLNADTKMYPNLKHAQAIPGICAGRGIGLIDTHSLPKMLEMTLLLNSSKSWTKESQKGLQKWVRKYLNWFLTSKNGKRESIEKNNHGTYYDYQVLGYAYFLGDRDLMNQYVLKSKKRFTSQINEKGQQPHEVKRTLSFTYSCFNLRAFIRICEYAELVDKNYWDLKKGSVKKAIGYLLKNAPPDNMENWPHKQIKSIRRRRSYYRVILQIIGTKLKEESFLKAAKNIDEDNVRRKLDYLMYPPKLT